MSYIKEVKTQEPLDNVDQGIMDDYLQMGPKSQCKNILRSFSRIEVSFDMNLVLGRARSLLVWQISKERSYLFQIFLCFLEKLSHLTQLIFILFSQFLGFACLLLQKIKKVFSSSKYFT